MTLSPKARKKLKEMRSSRGGGDNGIEKFSKKIAHSIAAMFTSEAKEDEKQNEGDEQDDRGDTVVTNRNNKALTRQKK